MLTRDQLKALFADNTVGDIEAADTRRLVDQMFDADDAAAQRLTVNENNITAVIGRVDDAEGDIDNLTDQTPFPWQSGVYQTGEVVSHNGKLWLATADTTAGDEPGVAPQFESLELERIADLAAAVKALTARVTALENP